MNKPNKNRQYSGYINVIILGLIFFGFPQVEKPLIEFAQTQINNLGILAPVGYILFGIFATVVAPIGLGPVNIVLQRAFGFWPSVFYFWTYETIGLSINFILSTYFGKKIIKYLFYAGNNQMMEVDPLTKLSSYMLNKSYLSAFVIMLGFGGELISYLAGLSKLSYFKFLSIIIFTNFINALLFVGSNLTIGTNNSLYFYINTVSFIITSLPLIIVFRKEIWSFIKQIISVYQTYKQEEADFKRAVSQFKSKESEFVEFSNFYINQIERDIQFNVKFLDKIISISNEDDDSVNKARQEAIVSVIKEGRKKLVKAKIDQETINTLYQLSQEKFLSPTIKIPGQTTPQ